MAGVDKNMPILIVDDYKTMLRIIRNLLKQLGFNNVDEAIDGSSALTKLRDKDFGLVISDWNMEPMSGLRLLKEVRADVKLKNIPFIMITAESKSEKRERHRRQGSRREQLHRQAVQRGDPQG
jgi:two-component system chemotaxis response regulator CheY